MHNLALITGRFGKGFRTELRQLAVHWLYLMLHVLWAALLVWMFVGRDDRSAQVLLETTLGRIAIGLISLVGLFLAGISGSRSRRAKFQELEDAFPTGFEVLTGHWLAGLFTLALFLVEPVAVAAHQGPLIKAIHRLKADIAVAQFLGQVCNDDYAAVYRICSPLSRAPFSTKSHVFPFHFS